MTSIFDKALLNTPGSAKAGLASAGMRDALIWGTVIKVNPETLLMDVQISKGLRPQIKRDIPINMSFTNDAYGLRVLPTPKVSIVLLYKVNSLDYIHVGYHYGNVSQRITNTSGDKENEVAVLLKRRIDSGEVQLVGLSNNEIYLSNDGSVLLKSQFGASLYLENYMHRLNGVFANLKYEMDGVRLRAGNIIRPLVKDTNEDEFLVLDENGNVVEERSLDEDKEGAALREFLIQVGVEINKETGVDEQGQDDQGRSLYPTVGYMALADKVINEKGEEVKVLDKTVNFRLKLANGCSIAIDEDGSFYILDDKKGSFTKFGVGDEPDKSIRSGDNMLLLNEKDGVYLKHSSGSSIKMDSDGNIQLNDSFKNSILMQKKGITINSPDGDITIIGKKIILGPESNVYIGSPENAADTILTAGGFSQIFDPHEHIFVGTGTVKGVQPSNWLSVPTNAKQASAKGIVVS